MLDTYRYPNVHLHLNWLVQKNHHSLIGQILFFNERDFNLNILEKRERFEYVQVCNLYFVIDNESKIG